MKTMHKIITLILIVSLTGLFSTNVIAQLNDKLKKQVEEKQKEEQTDQKKPENKLDQLKEEVAPTEKKAPVKVQKKEEAPEETVEPEPVFIPQVYTYNHTTSEQAKATQQMKKQELKTTVANADAKVKESREKIAAAREALEKDKKAKKIKDAVYYQKLDKIMKAEKWVNDLELSVQKGKELTAE
jgi:hypothetical protein